MWLTFSVVFAAAPGRHFTSDYWLTVDGRDVDVICVPMPENHIRNKLERQPYSYASFTATGSVEVCVKSRFIDLSKTEILPRSKGIVTVDQSVRRLRRPLAGRLKNPFHTTGFCFVILLIAMSLTMTMTEFQDTQRVRRMCVGNSDPIFVSGDDGEAQMVVLDAGIFRELYAKHQIYKKLEESERDFAEGRHQDAYEMLTDVFSPAHV